MNHKNHRSSKILIPRGLKTLFNCCWKPNGAFQISIYFKKFWVFSFSCLMVKAINFQPSDVPVLAYCRCMGWPWLHIVWWHPEWTTTVLCSINVFLQTIQPGQIVAIISLTSIGCCEQISLVLKKLHILLASAYHSKWRHLYFATHKYGCIYRHYNMDS